ncbi:uncharacterized protein LY79DRAFT_574445 [Colletotrichum navitas]|uniref:Uncharacterized protein n=1 Tax=Colletotrichum navitas TaxID=681940 RepID=A0AAD8VCY4_9PEZI|nr:uncharacterized protein LY79DRAFT_574445 [Colletotrichum navitas]KAK1600020.1 hypothetical protein LY79DRAFT_574445 [Colletotrichum navitas]
MLRPVYGRQRRYASPSLRLFASEGTNQAFTFSGIQVFGRMIGEASTRVTRSYRLIVEVARLRANLPVLDVKVRKSRGDLSGGEGLAEVLWLLEDVSGDAEGTSNQIEDEDIAEYNHESRRANNTGVLSKIGKTRDRQMAFLGLKHNPETAS